MITNADITIYNRQYDTEKKPCFIRHEIKGVSWYAAVKVSEDPSGLSGGNVVKIRIPESAKADGRPALERYLPPAVYRSAPAEKRAQYWTLENGDYFCKGEGREIEKPSDLKGLESYGQIRSVGDNRRGGLPHIRLEGW